MLSACICVANAIVKQPLLPLKAECKTLYKSPSLLSLNITVGLNPSSNTVASPPPPFFHQGEELCVKSFGGDNKLRLQVYGHCKDPMATESHCCGKIQLQCHQHSNSIHRLGCAALLQPLSQRKYPKFPTVTES